MYVPQDTCLNVHATATSTPDTCSNNTGTATAYAWNGTAPYSYLWSNGQTTQTITGLSSGTYSVTVTDANNTIFSATVVVNNTILSVISSVVPVSCFGGNNGSATVTVSGGIPPFTYLWSNAQTTQTATGLAVGSYSVVVTDATGCSITLSTVVTGSPLLSTNSYSTPSSCFTCPDGSATTNVNGGTPPYSYQWSNGQTTPGITGITPGSYTVCITDANGCVVCDSMNVLFLGVNELLNYSLNIFPNPSSGILFMDFGSRNFGAAEISVSGIVGEQLIRTKSAGSGKQKLDLYSLSNGIYFLQIRTEQGIVTRKVILSRK